MGRGVGLRGARARAMSSSPSQCPLCQAEQYEDQEKLEKGVRDLGELMERVRVASDASKKAAWELVRGSCGRAAGRRDDEDSDIHMEWFIGGNGGEGGEGAAILLEILGVAEGNVDGHESDGSASNNNKKRNVKESEKGARRFGSGLRKLSTTSTSNAALQTNARICELEELVLAAAAVDVTKTLFCRNGNRGTHLGAWLCALRVSSASQSVVDAARLLKLITQLRSMEFIAHDENEVDSATLSFISALDAMAPNFTLEEGHVVASLIDALEELARVELRRLADITQSPRKRLGISIALVSACQRLRRAVPCTAQAHNGNTVSMYGFLSDAAKARFGALEAVNTQKTPATTTKGGAAAADGEPKVASLEEIIGTSHTEEERRWHSLRDTVDRLARLVDAELEEEHAIGDEENRKIIDAVGLRPLSIAAGTWAGLIQDRLSQATGVGVRPSSRDDMSKCRPTVAYDTIFLVYKKLIALEHSLTCLIEDDRALGDSDSDGDSDNDDASAPSSGPSHVLMLEKFFSPSLISWADETKKLLEKVVTKIVAESEATMGKTSSERPRGASVVDNVVSVYTSLFDTVDVMSFALRVSATAVRVVEEVSVACVHHHAVLSTSVVTQINHAQQEYITSATVGITPMRKKSVNILRKVIAKTQGLVGSAPDTQRRRYAAQCAVLLAEMVFHKQKSRELLDAIRSHATTRTSTDNRNAEQLLVRESLGARFRELFSELDSLYGDVLNSFCTSILIINKNGPACVGAGGNRSSTSNSGDSGGGANGNGNGGGFVKSIMNNELESVKGVERKLYKAIKAIRPPPNEQQQGFGSLRRSQQSVDDAVEQGADCLRLVVSRLNAAFATMPATNADTDADMATTRKALKQAGIATTRAVLGLVLSRLATAIGDAATTTASTAHSVEDEPEGEDGVEHDEEARRTSGPFRMGRRWSSTSSSGTESNGSGSISGVGSGTNARKLEVATSTLNELEKLVHAFAESISIHDLHTPPEVEAVRLALKAAATPTA